MKNRVKDGTIKNEIKSIIVKEGWTITKINEVLNDKYNAKTTTVQNLINKLNRGTISYRETKDIAEILGYTITWIKNDI